MSKYKLYLDESYSEDKTHLVVAGFAISCDDESKLETDLRTVKEVLWNQEYINSNETVLHCTELSRIKSYRSSKSLGRNISRECYRFFKDLPAEEIKEKIDKVFEKIKIIIDTHPITVFGCVIDRKKYREYYSCDAERDDEYSIAIECILENYIHFLRKNDATGDIIYESRSVEDSHRSPDVIMSQNYAGVLVNNKGILGISPKETQKRLRVFSTVSKKIELPGLELTDFIDYYLAQYIKCAEIDKPDLLKAIEKKFYNSSFSLEERDLRALFGFRRFPFEYEMLAEQKIEISRLTSRLKNKKDETKRLNKKIEQLTEEKRKIQEELAALKAKIEEFEDNNETSTKRTESDN